MQRGLVQTVRCVLLIKDDEIVSTFKREISVNKLILKQEVLDASEGYLEAFKRGDQDGVEKYFSLPNYRFTENRIEEFDKFHSNLSELRRRGYYDTIAIDTQVVEINEEKAHLVLREGLRIKNDGSPLEEISSFYIFIKESGSWKIKFTSAFVFEKSSE